MPRVHVLVITRLLVDVIGAVTVREPVECAAQHVEVRAAHDPVAALTLARTRPDHVGHRTHPVP